MNSLWSLIEDVPDAAAALNWRGWFGSSFDAAAAAFLRRTDRTVKTVACTHGCGCGHRVISRRGKLIGICDCEEDCDEMALTEDDVRVFELDLKRLGRGIVNALRCDSRFVELGINRTLQVAALGSGPLPVIFSIQRDEESFSNVVAQLAARLPKGFILLAPTSRFCTATATEMLARVNAGFFDLATHLTLLSSGALRSSTTGEELFKAHLPEKQEAVKASEAMRIFTILQKLKSRVAGEKAPLYDVFVATVLDGLSQRAAATRCKCSPAQISKRVKELKVEFRMPLRQLQNYAKPLLEMQTSVKGDRRRKRKPGSGPGAFADDKPDDDDDSLPPEEYQDEEGGKDG